MNSINFANATDLHTYLAGRIALTPGCLEIFKSDFVVHDLKALEEARRGDTLVWVAYDGGTHMITISGGDDTRPLRASLAILEAVKKSFGREVKLCYHIYGNNGFVIMPYSLDAAIANVKERLDPDRAIAF